MAKMHKTVRLDTQYIDKIQSLGAGSFTECLEKMIDDYFYSASKREMELGYLDEEIKSKKRKLYEIDKVVKDTCNTLFELHNSISESISRLTRHSIL